MKTLEELQIIHKSKELQDIEYWKCAEDPYYFMTNWAFTLDVHDNENPIKPFPEKEYIKITVKEWLDNKLLLVPKSRQMMASWIFVTLYLWDTQFHKGRLTFFQSKKSDDANDLVKRAKFIWDNEPTFLKRYYQDGNLLELKCNPQAGGQHVYGLMTFPQINSEIRGVPEGGDVVRMHTLSGLLSDEMAFQTEARASYTASRPTISSGGRLTGISTADDNSFFEQAVFDLLDI